MSKLRSKSGQVAAHKRHTGYWKHREGRAVTLDARQVDSLCYHAKWLCRRWQADLGPALRALGSHHAIECHEHIVGAAKLAHVVQQEISFSPLR